MKDPRKRYGLTTWTMPLLIIATVLMAAHIAKASDCTDDVDRLKVGQKATNIMRAGGELTDVEGLNFSFHVGTVRGVLVAHGRAIGVCGKRSAYDVMENIELGLAFWDRNADFRKLGEELPIKCDIAIVMSAVEALEPCE